MAVDERSRLQLADAAKRAFGDDAGITLMELLPPVGWADVATKQDLAILEARMDGRFGQVDARFDRIDARFDRVDARFDQVDARFDRMEARFDRMEARLDGTDGRLDGMEERLELKFQAQFERGFRKVVLTVATLMVTGMAATVAAVYAH
jgi:hypothetical protein